MEKERQYFCMCKVCGHIFPYEDVIIDEKNDAYCKECKKTPEVI